MPNAPGPRGFECLDALQLGALYSPPNCPIHAHGPFRRTCRPKSGKFFVFEHLQSGCQEEVISRPSKRPRKSDFTSVRNRAWRNGMVAGINAGLDQRLYSLRPGDNGWPRDKDAHREPYVFRFNIGDIPAIASVSDIGWEELSLHVAFWPTPNAERWIGTGSAGFLAGDLFSTGWLERRDGAWLQVPLKPQLFCRKPKLPVAAILTVEPRGYADRGNLR